MEQHITYNYPKSFIAQQENKNLHVFDAKIGSETFVITDSQPRSQEEWHHILVRPNLYQTPSYEAMAEISDAFFQGENEYGMQVIPKRKNYISKEEFTLHLWDMKSPCNFNFNEAYDYLFHKKYFNFKDDICVQHCSDNSSNKYIAVITERRWPTWKELVKAKEKFLGEKVDAVIINRNLANDITAFRKCTYKIVFIWEASSIKLPDKKLV